MFSISLIFVALFLLTPLKQLWAPVYHILPSITRDKAHIADHIKPFATSSLSPNHLYPALRELHLFLITLSDAVESLSSELPDDGTPLIESLNLVLSCVEQSINDVGTPLTRLDHIILMFVCFSRNNN